MFLLMLLLLLLLLLYAVADDDAYMPHFSVFIKRITFKTILHCSQHLTTRNKLFNETHRNIYSYLYTSI